MKKLRPPNRDIVVTHNSDEILDSVVDSCISENDPEPKRVIKSANRNQLSNVNKHRSSHDAAFGTEVIGALAARMALPAACDPDLSFQKSRIVSRREYLYNQIANDWHVHPRTIRKPSGIVSNRSDMDLADDDWDMGVDTARKVWVEQRTKEQPHYEDDHEEDKQTYVIRARSRESLVSELTAFVPVASSYRKESDKDFEPASQLFTSSPNQQYSQRKKETNSKSSRAAPFSRKEIPAKRNGGGNPRFRVFRGDTSDVKKSKEVINDEEKNNRPHVRGVLTKTGQPCEAKSKRPSPISGEAQMGGEEQSPLETIEVIHKHMEYESYSLLNNQSERKSTDGQNVSTNSSSAFVPVRRKEPTGIYSQTSHKKPPLRNPPVISTLDKEMSDKSSQITNSSVSTKRIRNNIKSKKKDIHSSETSKCDTTVSSAAGGVSLGQLERANPCIVNTSLLGGLFACHRGNKAERFEAEKEEWKHIMVFEPTKRSIESAHRITKLNPKFLPASIITGESSLGTSHRSTHTVDVLPESPAKESLLLGQRREVSMKAQMAATLKSVQILENKDACDIVEAGDGAGEKRDLAPPTSASSYDDKVHTFPTNPTENQDDGKNQRKTSKGAYSSFWSFSGGCASELDHLTPSGRPKPKRTFQEQSNWGHGLHSLQRGSNSRCESLSPKTMHGLRDTFSDYGTELTTAPSLVHSRADSLFSGSWAKSPKVGSVYERRRMASRETYPIFHWQETLDDSSVGIMSLNC